MGLIHASSPLAVGTEGRCGSRARAMPCRGKGHVPMRGETAQRLSFLEHGIDSCLQSIYVGTEGRCRSRARAMPCHGKCHVPMRGETAQRLSLLKHGPVRHAHNQTSNGHVPAKDAPNVNAAASDNRDWDKIEEDAHDDDIDVLCNLVFGSVTDEAHGVGECNI